MKKTDYSFNFDWSLMDLIPAKYDFSYEPPITPAWEFRLKADFPIDWSDVLRVRLFTVEGAMDSWTGEVIFWGGFWFTILGIKMKTALYIGWRKE